MSLLFETITNDDGSIDNIDFAIQRDMQKYGKFYNMFFGVGMAALLLLFLLESFIICKK